MDLDRESLELMLNLLDTDSRIKDALEDSGNWRTYCLFLFCLFE